MKTIYLIPAFLMLLTACNLDQRLNRVSKEIEQVYEQTRLWQQLPRRTISWQQALVMLRKSNPDIISINNQIKKAERNTLSVYTDMIPGVSYYGYFNNSISGLANSVNSDNFRSSVNVTFNLPSLTKTPYRVYAAQARVFAAMKAKEGKEREIISKLYHTVRKHELAQRKAALERRRPNAAFQNDATPAPQQENTQLEYWKSLALLLGDTSARWEILPSSLPTFNWSKYRPQLNRLSPLVVCQHALKLEQARLSQYGVALSYLPTINTGLYSPELFSSSGGTYSGTFLDMDDTRLNLSISYSLDTNLSNWNSYKDAKERYEQVKNDIRRSLLEHKQKMAILKRSINDYLTWRSYMRKRINFQREAPADSGESFLERANSLHDMELELLTQEEKFIDSESSIILEYGTL